MTAKTPVYGLEYIVEGEPARNTRAALENNAKTIEAALLAGGIAPPGAADLAALSGRVTSLEALPLAVVRQSTSQSIAAGVWVPIAFQVADLDTEAPGAPQFAAGSPTRITIRRKGIYRVDGVVSHGGGIASTVRVGAQIQKNGVAIAMGSKNAAGAASATSSPVDTPSLLLTLLVNDYVGLAGVQSTAGAVSTAVFADTASYLSVQCVRLLP